VNGSGAMAERGLDGGDPLRPASPRLRSPQASGTATLDRVEDTVALGSRLGAELRAGDVVVLSGALGAGKTVLAGGIAAAMDVDGPVTSPTCWRGCTPRGAPALQH